MPDIFEKSPNPKPSQLAAVADRRFADAEALLNTGHNARANGAQYLAGFVIEILLKAKLMTKYPATARKRQHEVRPEERPIWSLIWRSHDLDEMLARLPELEAAIAKHSERAGVDHLARPRAICATWSIQARYSSSTSTITQADDFMERVRSIKELLK